MARYSSDTLLLLRKRLRLDQEEMGRLLGVTRSFVSRMERDRFEISAATAERMEEIAAKNGINLMSLLAVNAMAPAALEEGQAPYSAAPAAPAAGTPTRAAIEARVRAFLDAAERVPGGLGYASIQVQLHLDPSRLAALDPGHDPAEKLREWLAAQKAAESGEASRRRA